MTDDKQATNGWTAKQVYILSAICLVVGLAIGFLVRGSESTKPVTTAAAQPPAAAMPGSQGQQMPSLDDMKRMADKAAEPVLAQLKTDPKNTELLIKAGNAYKSAHQFKEAAQYFGQALAQKPSDIGLRDEVAADQYYAGDTDGAIATFEAGLKIAPNDPSTLLDLGLVKLRKKGDAKGAIELWQRLLAKNPNLPADKKNEIRQLIAKAQAGPIPQ